MADLVLTEDEQEVVRSLLALDPAPGGSVPPRTVLDLVARLVPVSAVGVAVADVTSDRTPGDPVVQVFVTRSRRTLGERDLALLRMVAPALQRLLRQRPAAQLPSSLTVTERRVLQLLATGMSNADIATCLGVAPCTVRKHLEHAFPKLGVTNRLAAARAFETGVGPRTPADMFA